MSRYICSYKETPVQYTIRIRERLNTLWTGEYDFRRISYPLDGGTIFAVNVRDPSELYGVLTCLRNMGVTLISVHNSNVKNGTNGGKQWTHEEP